MTERTVPPLPGKKPPLTDLFGASKMALPIPDLTLQGGDAGASGGFGTQGNIGNLTLGSANFKSSSWLNYVVIGGFVLLGVMLWRKK